MTKVRMMVLVATAVTAAHVPPAAAEAVKFRFVASVAADEKGSGLKLPEGLACDGKGQVVVADTGNDRLVRFTYAEGSLGGGAELKLPELSAPGKVQLDSQGDIYTLDTARHRVVRIGPHGEFKGTVAYEGAPPPSTIVVRSFAIDAADRLYVLDAFGRRVLVLDAEGRFARAIEFPADARFASDLSIDTNGTVVALDAIGRRLYAAAPDATAFAPRGGDLSSAIASLPSSLTVFRGSILVVEAGAGTIVSLARDGTFLSRQLAAGRADGTLAHPAQMCLTEAGDMFIADRDNARVQLFTVVR